MNTDTSAFLGTLVPGSMIAVRHKQNVHVAKVERIFRDQELVEVTLYHVPNKQRFGPWERRPWEITNRAGSPIEVIPAAEIISRVTLQEGALTQASLEVLASSGVQVGIAPRAWASLPRG